MGDAQNAAENRNKTETSSGGEAARAPRSAPRVVLQVKTRQGTRNTGNCGVAEREEDAGAVAPSSGSQKTPDDSRVVRRDVCRSDSAACTERTKSDDVGIEAF